MIVLFNLNTYLGGGEILAIRFAEYLKSNSIDYVILTSDSNDCFIRKEAVIKNLNYNLWPVRNDSVAYMSFSEKEVVIDGLNRLYQNKNLEIFTFCYRDLYNALSFFPKINNIKLKICTGIYHPEDIYYLSSYALDKQKIVSFNQRLAKLLYSKNSIVFPNENAFETTLGLSASDNKGIIIPIPIDLKGSKYEKQKCINSCDIKIVCISRFVNFKMGAIMALLRLAKSKRNIKVDLIGYGLFDKYLRLYVSINKLENVKLLGKIAPSKLEEIISKADIGYAQGTSIMEIAKFGLPVIIAPYGKIWDLFDKNFKCMGIFGEKESYNYGDKTNDGSELFEPLETVLNRLINNYQYFSEKSYYHLQKFSSEKVFKNILELIYSSQSDEIDMEFTFPSPPVVKKIFRKLILTR